MRPEDADAPAVPVYADLQDALREHPADVVIIATPLQVHAGLCELALRAGADVLLEKPPFPTLAQFDRLCGLQIETGRAVQIGFQSLGSHALAAFAADELGIGPVTSVAATGLWTRRRSYWARSRWAGRRSLDGMPVVDGVTTNPLAHAVATALRIAGFDTGASADTVVADLYRANAIDGDDTSVITVKGRGVPVTCALTLCAPERESEDRGATVLVTGTRGTARFSYTTDVVDTDAGRTVFGRDDLLANLLDHRRDGTPLLVPLESTGAFMRVVEAVRTAGEPYRIAPQFIDWVGEGADAHPVVDDIEQWVARAAAEGATFASLGAPWARTEQDHTLATLHVAGHIAADYEDGAGTSEFSSPHPYLHPLTSRAGVIVSSRHPADHDWHAGLSFTVQDAAGVNFWGGRTYLPGAGYAALDDHGQIVADPPTTNEGSLRHELTWRGPDGRAVLTEERRLRWSELGEDAWALSLDIALHPATSLPVQLSSPGAKGRAGAGYGGLFLRLAPCRDAEVFTPETSGEDAVNGSRSAWIAWAARFEASPDAVGEATVILAPGDTETAGDPWFVRQREYPGIGSAVAWEHPVSVPADAGLRRRYLLIVADGLIAPELASTLTARAAQSLN